MSIIIELTDEEVELCRRVAAARDLGEEQSKKSRRDQAPGRFAINFTGTLGEYALAKHLETEFNDLLEAKVDPGYDTIYRGWKLDAKSSRYPYGSLWAPKRDIVADVLVKCVVLRDDHHVELIGWIWKEDWLRLARRRWVGPAGGETEEWTVLLLDLNSILALDDVEEAVAV